MEIQDPKAFMQSLVDLFYPLVEVSRLDIRGKCEEVLNSFSSLKEDEHFSGEGSYEEVLASNRTVKTLIYPIKSGFLRLRFDLSCFQSLGEQIDLILKAKVSAKPIDQWKKQIDQVVTHYLHEQKITIGGVSPRHKREIIAQLEGQGLFDFKEASSYIATKLNTSRATIYNYLKTVNQLGTVHVHQVDSFTDKKFGGNPAGVVLDAEQLDVNTMKKIARELNLSETSFVFPSKKADFKLRYFTPTGHEVVFCGHSTVGALYMIAHEHLFGVDKPGFYKFTVETQAGVLPMQVDTIGKDQVQVAFETPPVKMSPSKITHQKIADACGIDISLIDQSFPIMYEKTNKDLFVYVNDLKNLEKVQCNARGLTAFSKKNEIVALCLLTKGAFDRKNQFHMRCFSPVVGTNEDPFTGSVLGGLAAYIDQNRLLAKGAKTFRVEQGHFVNRPGVVEVKYTKKKGQYKVSALAQAVHCFSTEIKLS